MRRRSPLFVGTLVAMLIARAVSAQALSPFDTLKARVLLERSLPCLGCHRLGTSGGRIGPDLSTVRQRRSAQYIADIITDPGRVVPGSAMPRTPLTPSTRTLLIRYFSAGATVRAASPAATPPVAAGEVNGVRLYARWCAPCHGPQGAGDGPNAALLPVPPTAHRNARVMSRRSDDQLFDAIAVGGAAMGRSPRMPAFGATLSPPEIWSLVAHLRTLCRCRPPSWSMSSYVTPATR